MKKIVMASDHAGFDLKNTLVEQLKNDGYDVEDAGTYSKDSCDYPVFAEKACRYMLDGKAELCILVCGTGIGMSMAANKHRGIRAALCGDTYSARFTRMHNDANVLCMGANVVGGGLAFDIIDTFLSNEFEGGRHKVRVDMVMGFENNP